jgi:hypothetical protein
VEISNRLSLDKRAAAEVVVPYPQAPPDEIDAVERG